MGKTDIQNPRRKHPAVGRHSVLSPQSSVLVALALLASVAVACSTAPPTAETLNHQANLAYTAGDYGTALEQYRRAEVLRPDLPALNYNTGNVLQQQNDFQRAIDEEKKAVVSTDPNVQDHGYYSMGNAEVRSNLLPEAVDAYKSALRADPSDMDAKYNLEVIQRRLAQDQARQQAVKNQENQQPPPSASQGQPNQSQQQQPGAPQGGSQPGQPQPGQPQPGQQGQQGQPGQPGQSGQPGQPGQGQPGQQGQTGQPSQGQPGQPAQPAKPSQGQQPPASQPATGAQSAANGQGQSGAPSGSSGGVASGYTGTAAGQADALDPNLQHALSQFDKSQSIDDALRALDLIGQQERLREAAQNSGAQPEGRDW